MALLATLGCVGCETMDKPSMDEPITADTVLDAERRMTGGRDTLLAPQQQQSAARKPAVPDEETPEGEFPSGLADPPRRQGQNDDGR